MKPNPIETLYHRHYASAGTTAMTSSHWEAIGEKPELLKSGDIQVRGLGGFGDFVPDTFANRVKHLPYHFLMDHYVRQYSHDLKVLRISRAVAKASGRVYLLDCAKHAVVVETALKALGSANFIDKGIQTVAIIGDGYGYLGNLLKALSPSLKIVFINLGKQLVFDMQLSKRVHPEAKIQLIETDADLKENADMFFVEAEKFELLEAAKIDLFFNIASMQEMNKVVVDRYFDLMRSSSAKQVHFYCCNRVLKTLPDGEVIRFDDYHWRNAKTVWEESDPPWYREYPARTPPFWRPFDGKFKARLVKF